MDVDGYLTDEGWTADIRLPWENFAEPELRRPHPLLAASRGVDDDRRRAHPARLVHSGVPD